MLGISFVPVVFGYRLQLDTALHIHLGLVLTLTSKPQANYWLLQIPRSSTAPVGCGKAGHITYANIAWARLQRSMEMGSLNCTMISRLVFMK